MGACSLLIKELDGKKRVVPIERPTLSLGRSQDNDVVLTDSELRVSRRHAVIEWDPEKEQITNSKQAAAMLERPYRKPWDAVLKSLLS